MRSIGIGILVMVGAQLLVATTLAPALLGQSQVQGQQNPELVPDPEANRGSDLTTDPEYGRGTSGTMDVDVSGITDADTDASGVDETGIESGADSDQGSLPDTASELSLIGLIGALALAMATGLRFISRRS